MRVLLRSNRVQERASLEVVGGVEALEVQGEGPVEVEVEVELEVDKVGRGSRGVLGLPRAG